MSTSRDQIAYNLWRQASPQHTVDPASARATWLEGQSLGWVVAKGGHFELAKTEEVWNRAAHYVADQLLYPLLADTGALFTKAYRVWLDGGAIESAVEGRALAHLHNQRKVDLFAAASSIVSSWKDIFSLLQILTHAVPFVEHARAESIFKLELTYAGRVANDGAGEQLPNELRAWFEYHPHVARRIVDLHLAGPDKRSNALFINALAGLSKSALQPALDLAMAGSRTESPDVYGPSTLALGQLAYEAGSPSIAAAIARLDEILEGPEGDRRDRAVGALVRVIERGFGDDDRIVVLPDLGVVGAYWAANWVATQPAKAVEKPWIDEVLGKLARCATAAYPAVCERFDSALYRLTKTRDAEISLRALEEWIRGQTVGDVDLEDSLPRTLNALSERPQNLSRVFTKWLQADDTLLPEAALRLSQWAISHIPSCKPEFELELLKDFTTSDFVFLLRRTLGYVHQRDHLLGLILSLARVPNAKEKVFAQIHEAILWGPGYDYGPHVLETLESELRALDSTDPRVDLFNALVQSIKEYEDAVNALPERKELGIPYVKLRAIARQHRKMNDEITRAAEQQSVFASIAVKISIKAGIRTFGKHGGEYGADMTLSRLSHEVPWPRSESTQPVGRSLERTLYRRASRGKRQ